MDAQEPILITAVPGLPEIEPGFQLGAEISDRVELDDDDILVISQKAVSKAEDRVVSLDSVDPRPEAVRLGSELGKDPRLVELILAESRSIVRTDLARGIIITETREGFVCANSGIDASNLNDPDSVILLPRDSDQSARLIRAEIEDEIGTRPAVIISDSFGRAWRHGQVEVALGCAGIEVLDDWRGLPDRNGRILTSTAIGIADQIAATSDLARSKTSGTPVIRIRGLGRFVHRDNGPGCRSQIRSPEEDLFR